MEELPVPQSCEDPCGGKFHAALCMGFVLWMADPCRNNRGVVVFGHFLVRPVEHGFRPGILCNTGLKIVRNQQTGHTAKVVVGMDMAVNPVFQLHVVAGFRIGKAAAGQNGHKQICFGYLTGNRIMDVQGCTSPVHLHDISGFVLNAHGGFCRSGPLTVLLTILGVHVGHSTLRLAFGAVLLPEYRQIHPLPGQLCMDVGIVRQNIQGRFLTLLRKQQLHKHLVGAVLRYWPADSGLSCCVQNLPDGVMGTAQLQFHSAHTFGWVRSDPQDVSVVKQFECPPW